eukprot:scaffold14005_cov30-Tisochrysis_lutea.AAC.1
MLDDGEAEVERSRFGGERGTLFLWRRGCDGRETRRLYGSPMRSAAAKDTAERSTQSTDPAEDPATGTAVLPNEGCFCRIA